MLIYRAWIRKNGRKIYARDYGKKCFVFEVDEEKSIEKIKDESHKLVSKKRSVS